MKITVSPSSFNGEIRANPSKSIMQRVVAISTLTEMPVNIYYPDNSEDSQAAIRIAETMGCDIINENNSITIHKTGTLKNHIWNVGESGLSARIFSAIAGLYDEDITITGHGTLLKRSMQSLITALTRLGLIVEHRNHLLPLIIKGKINKFRSEIDAADGSQILTGLLIAMAKAEYESEILVQNLSSKPYIDVTLCTLRSFGIMINNENYTRFTIPADQKLQGIKLKIEGDWSGAAFQLVGAAISGRTIINELNPLSLQGDRSILDVLKIVGAKVTMKHDKIIVEKDKLNSFFYDATNTPDLFPPLAVLAANCIGISIIKGISRLLNKESDRFKSIQQEFKKLGIKIEKVDDQMVIHGGKVVGGNVNSNNDHRIAMALATLGLNSKNEITIENAECVSKSYPDYFNDYQILGGKIKSDF
jgi:3-phosphoshikimate 1-carboxyvinyltransferase